MTLFRAVVATAQTSNPAHFSPNTGFVAGCTIAAGGNTVVIDSALPGGDSTAVTAGSFVIGAWYRITSSGTTSFTAIGAGSNTPGVEFQATGVGTGTGQAVAIPTITTAAAGAAPAGGSFTLSAAVAIGTHIRAGTTACLTVSGSNNYTLSGVRIVGGTVSGAVGINHTGSGLITVAASSSVLAGASGAHGITVNGSGTLLRLDNALDVKGGQTTAAYGVNLLGGTIEVVNNSVVNGSATTIASHGINGAAGTTIILSNSTVNGGSGVSGSPGISTAGNVTGSNNVFNAGIAEALVVTGNGVMALTGTNQANASATNFAITATSATVTHTFSGIENNRPSAGVTHQSLNVRRFNRPNTGQQINANAPDNTLAGLFSADSANFNNPATSDVRSGVTYGPGGGLLGTLTTTTAPTLEQIATAVWTTAGTRTLSTGGVEAISDRLEREGGPLASVATDETVAAIVTTTMSAT